MLKLSSLKIDPEFSAQILPLSFDELHQLELNMIRDGKLTDPIIVWNKTILDGHNRYNLLEEAFIYRVRDQRDGAFQPPGSFDLDLQSSAWAAQPDTRA